MSNDDRFEVVWDGNDLVVATPENSPSRVRERELARDRRRDQEWGDDQFKCRD